VWRPLFTMLRADFLYENLVTASNVIHAATERY
jgi:hypothetical protein